MQTSGQLRKTLSGEPLVTPTWGAADQIATGYGRVILLIALKPKTQEIFHIAGSWAGTGILTAAAWGPNGLIAVGSSDGNLFVLQSGEQGLRFVAGYKTDGAVGEPAWGPNGLLAAHSNDGKVYLFQVQP